MRLSEDRIYAVSEKIAEHLKKKRLISSKASINQLASWIEQPIYDNLHAEEEIDTEVRRQIDNLQNKPPEGSFDYQALFQRKKEEIAQRRGYKL